MANSTTVTNEKLKEYAKASEEQFPVLSHRAIAEMAQRLLAAESDLLAVREGQRKPAVRIDVERTSDRSFGYNIKWLIEPGTGVYELFTAPPANTPPVVARAVARVIKDGFEVSWLDQSPEPYGTLLYIHPQAPAVTPEEKDERTTACVNAFEGIETEHIAGKSLGEFLAGEVSLNKSEPNPDGSFGFTLSGFAIQIMAKAFGTQFKSSGAKNYLELLFEHDELGPLTVTMQRVEGLTPVQKLTAAEQRVELLNSNVDALSRRIAELELTPHQYFKLPEGLRIVPIKPTREQLAVVKVAGKSSIYRDMVLAAPEYSEDSYRS